MTAPEPKEKTMNPVVHFEMPYQDRERIARFYQSAFGWKMQMLGPEMGNYVVVTTAEADAMPDGKRGAINGGFFAHDPKMPGQHPSVVVSVPDIQAAMKAVNKAGGEVLGEPMEIPGIGQYVAFYDTERNRVSMLQPRAQGSR
jgi:predicted enzyme related to lactoylglutathione lyase